MVEAQVIQGRQIGDAEVALIRGLVEENPEWGRTRLSRELCRVWSWYAANGRLKDMACRTLLLKLRKAGRIALPPPQRPANNDRRNRSVPFVSHSTEPIEGDLHDLLPLHIDLVDRGHGDWALFHHLVQTYHYLGHRSSVGETLRYLIRDRQSRVIACLMFGSAAWAVQARDQAIGWRATQRRQRLAWVTNNRRFLILPWVRVANVASYLLSQICRRVRADWTVRYDHPVWALETFVDRSRFRGTCYRAAGWLKVGQTSGRTRNGTRDEALSTIKDVYLYGLAPDFRRILGSEATAASYPSGGTNP